ncbi:calcium signal-modulating cyclophilin ligand [Trichomycterus rosablanca]|uniref:calcium signal-modulating cyclophilin ligand n=1 Tax=Trichomycterus rosablanca TaxID=2290929 RepID=UPI002F3592CF
MMDGEGELNKASVEEKQMSSVQRRSESRRRKLLLTSDQRLNKILHSNQQSDLSESRRVTEPRFHLDLDQTEGVSSSVTSKRHSPFIPEVRGEGLGGSLLDDRRKEEEDERGVRIRPRGETSSEERSRSPQRGINTYLSRFDDAIKLRGQLANEKAVQESGGGEEEFDSFRWFRLVGSAVLAVFVRLFVCHYLSIFAPFLTLELAYMGLYQYFPKVERKMKTTVLSAALLLSGIPAEVINRSAETYRKMGDVFSDLCVYFFTFITCHELLLLFSSSDST